MKRSKCQLFLVPVLMISLCSLKTIESEKTFKIEISEDDKNVKLVCQQGCAWKKLSFTKPAETNVLVDEFGMVNATAENTSIDSSLADFKFSITTKGDKYILQSKKGTNWKDLSFNMKPYAAPVGLDMNGMTLAD